MRTLATRAQHSRAGLRSGTDVTDAAWLVLAPFLPPARVCGCLREWPIREIGNAIFHVLRGGIAWSLLPTAFPPSPSPSPTVYAWFARLRDDSPWETINYHLVMRDRERGGREASPTAVMIDSQTVKTTESGGVRGYDGGKKIKGRKRHAMVDTDGRAHTVQAHLASIQDRDGAGPLPRASQARWPFVALGYADGGYAGPRVANASSIRVEVVGKADQQVGFAVIARRWVVERFFAWVNRNRRLAKDVEASIESVVKRHREPIQGRR